MPNRTAGFIGSVIVGSMLATNVACGSPSAVSPAPSGLPPLDVPPPPTIARAIDSDRLCCRFLRFQVTVEPNEGPIVLELTGPEGTRDFLAALIEW